MIETNIIHGDCLEKMAQLQAGTVDLIVADPPYNLGKNYGNGSDSKEREQYLQFTRDWLSKAARVLKPSGTIYVFMGVRFISHLYIVLEQELEFYFNGWISWHYTQGMGKKKGYSPRHEDILYFTRSKEFVFNLDAIRVPQKYYRSRNNMRGANPGDVWEFSHVHYCQGSRTEHPTQKPEGLIERMVLASSNEGDLVLDPFLGSGTTLRVCQQLNRRSIGIELNYEYVDMAKRRLREPFCGLDSIDPRMKRIPNDLNDPSIREEYRQNHKRWFLHHHEKEQREFDEAFKLKYGTRNRQQELFADS